MLFIVELKLLMLNCPLVENEFKLLKMVVFVVLILGISKYDTVDKLFKLLNIVELYTDELIMLSYTDNPEQLISDKHVKLL